MSSKAGSGRLMQMVLSQVKERAAEQYKEDQAEELFWSMWERPIIYDTLGRDWADTVPSWIKDEILLERIVQVMTKEGGKATDAEVVAYLYTASLARPMGSEYTNIYVQLAAGLVKKRGIAEIPKGLEAFRPLTADETRMLDDLRRDIWNSGVRNSRDKRRERNKMLADMRRNRDEEGL